MAKTSPTESCHIRMPLPLKKRIHAAAKRDTRTFQNMVLRLVERGLTDYYRENGK